MFLLREGDRTGHRKDICENGWDHLLLLLHEMSEEYDKTQQDSKKDKMEQKVSEAVTHPFLFY